MELAPISRFSVEPFPSVDRRDVAALRTMPRPSRARTVPSVFVRTVLVWSSTVDSLTLRVMVFGEEGAGKTVYLAGLFRQMSVSRPGSVVTLDADLADRHALNQIYRKVVSPELIEFPPSTHWGSKAWQFSCRITNRHGSFQPLSVKYLDYEGRMLDPMNGPLQMSAEDIEADDGLAELDEFRTNADVFLVLIDGLRLWHMLRGVPKYAGWLDNYLSERLQEIERGQDRRGARRPMHLVITKWDLLDGRMVDGQPVTLSTIAALIAEQPTFADHLATRAYENDGAPVRLIPVSVTGPFAAYDE